MGTFYVAWEVGITAGSMGAGLLLEVTGFPVTLLLCSVVPMLGAMLAFLARGSPMVPSGTPSP
jgi:predicted MFS family arabinose efflux permease